MTRRPATSLASLLVTVAALALGGCSVTIGTKTVSRTELEKQVSSMITDASEEGAAFDVSCDGELIGKVKQSQECVVTDDAGTTGLHVVVTGVDGSDVTFDLNPYIRVADLEKRVEELVADGSSAGSTVDVTCEGELTGQVDATQDCLVTDGQGSTGLHLRVTDVKGLRLTFDSSVFIRPDDLEAAITKLGQQQGISVESIDCPDELPGTVGSSVVCSGTPADTVGDLKAEVTHVKGLRIDFNVTPAR